MSEEIINKRWHTDERIGLRPCPFCGGSAEMLHIGNERIQRKNKSIKIKCRGRCRTEQVNACTQRFDFTWLEDVAIAHWNTREGGA